MFLFASLIERKSYRTCRGFYFFPSFSKKLQISNFVVFFGARKKTGVKFKTFVTFFTIDHHVNSSLLLVVFIFYKKKPKEPITKRLFLIVNFYDTKKNQTLSFCKSKDWQIC